LNALGFRCSPPPAGAFYAFPDISSIAADSTAFSRELLDKAHIATVPGVVFGKEGEGHLRFSYSLAPEIIEKGLESLSNYLKTR
ncbi:MAG TPA: aminotransferase class I/II-fold pyridoxal phosphate-dependent enzyme, partial [Acidobacteriota bacterium]|nr:aminotransferase class I/II-fold pyridoxal phosphate-dependent enzyme [Acidobacteriota bacterium]